VNGELRVDVAPDRAADVTQILAAAGHWVTELRPDRFSLEDVFLELTKTDSDGAAEPDIPTASATADELEAVVA
jgi:hypothetical protein